ncbi:Pectinesterase [Forsythia ovata]|uniref:Pectinesterase n=1 Tax=Forsythia ovata TaxID=205694 RepID=A0ABD1RKX0_9LAMI
MYNPIGYERREVCFTDTNEFFEKSSYKPLTWLSKAKRKLLSAGPASLKPNAVVAQDGSGTFKTINEAVATISKKNNQTFVIFVKAGIYKEIVIIPKKMNKIVLIGEGPTKTISTRTLSTDFSQETKVGSTAGVNSEATNSVMQNFWESAMASTLDDEEETRRDIRFENTVGANKHQAVAIKISGDKAIERLLGAALGTLVMGVVVFEQRRSIYSTISQLQSQPREPIFGRKSRLELAHVRNEAVDKTLGPEIFVRLMNSIHWCILRVEFRHHYGICRLIQAAELKSHKKNKPSNRAVWDALLDHPSRKIYIWDSFALDPDDVTNIQGKYGDFNYGAKILRYVVPCGGLIICSRTI